MLTSKRLEAIRGSGLAKLHLAVKELLAEIDRCWGELEAAKVLVLDIADERNRLTKLRSDIIQALGVDRQPAATVEAIKLMVRQSSN